MGWSLYTTNFKSYTDVAACIPHVGGAFGGGGGVTFHWSLSDVSPCWGGGVMLHREGGVGGGQWGCGGVMVVNKRLMSDV